MAEQTPPEPEKGTSTERLRGALEPLAQGLAGALPSLADVFLPGAGIAVGGAGALAVSLFSRHAENQTRRLIAEVQERVSRLESAGQLDRERVGRWEELGGLQAISANALSAPAKTEFYADLLAGVVSTEAPEPLDVDSFLATLQSLSVEEIKLARKINDAWEKNENAERSTGVSAVWAGEDQAYYMKRLEGAGLIDPRTRTGPVGAGVSISGYEPTPTLGRLVQLLRSGRADPTAVDP
jgi:hypothetical protein